MNIVVGSNPAENAMYGDMESHAERYARTREFIAIMRELWRGAPVDHELSALSVQGRNRLSRVPPAPVPIYLGGHSEDAQRIAAELADVYLLWGDTVAGVAKRLATMRAQEAQVKRLADSPVRYGLRCHVVVRETEDEAWKVAERLISRIDPEVRRKFIETTAVVDSEGQRCQLELAASSSLIIEENLWAGVGLARSGVGVAIVGSPAQVAQRSCVRIRRLGSARLFSRGIRTSRSAGDEARWRCRCCGGRATGEAEVVAKRSYRREWRRLLSGCVEQMSDFQSQTVRRERLSEKRDSLIEHSMADDRVTDVPGKIEDLYAGPFCLQRAGQLACWPFIPGKITSVTISSGACVSVSAIESATLGRSASITV